jgi:hypothetical protein
MRRTYATRELYRGRNLWALRFQLGHEDIKTTLGYIKFDRYEHPAEVRDALDRHGRNILALWKKPLLLQNLDSEERTALLRLRNEREQDVGLCRHEHCLKAAAGNPPPCSLCEHLVTGPEFFIAWDNELDRRERGIEELRTEYGSDHTVTQLSYQLEQFKANYAYLKGRSS